MNWKPVSIAPEDKRLVWIISEHGKKVYPSSYAIFGGQVCYSTALHPDWPELRWRVEQGDERGCGWCSWEPDEILAWCYVEEFTEVFDVLNAHHNADDR